MATLSGAPHFKEPSTELIILQRLGIRLVPKRLRENARQPAQMLEPALRLPDGLSGAVSAHFLNTCSRLSVLD